MKKTKYELYLISCSKDWFRAMYGQGHHQAKQRYSYRASFSLKEYKWILENCERNSHNALCIGPATPFRESGITPVVNIALKTRRGLCDICYLAEE